MNTEPKGLEILFLWRLALAGGGDWLKELKPDPQAPARTRMEKAGLIEAESKLPEGGRRKQKYYALTEKGWGWLAENLEAPIQTRTPATLEILVRLLARLNTHFNATGLSLAEFVQPSPGDEHEVRGGLSQRIASAYFTLSGGKSNVRVRLADLREALSDVVPRDLDAELLDLATTGRASLYRLDNPLEISPRDREATLLTPSGEERHVIYLGGRGS